MIKADQKVKNEFVIHCFVVCYLKWRVTSRGSSYSLFVVANKINELFVAGATNYIYGGHTDVEYGCEFLLVQNTVLFH